MDGAIDAAMRAWLGERFGRRVRFAEPLSRHTSFRIGGPADALVEVATPAEIAELQRTARARGIPIAVLGIGTNVLVADRGVRGVVVKLGRALGAFEWTGSDHGWHVRAGAAAPFKKLVRAAAARGLTGLEFAEGIPGSIGGGLLMNAGAFGGEISHCVTGICVVDAAGERALPRTALRFGYRRFDLPADSIVTRVDFALSPGAPEAIRAAMADAKRKRDGRQPRGLPNAGSVFKNPPGEFAGRLIEAAGLKGRRVGDAMISPQHANFIVNVGAATAADVKRLMDEVAATVWRARAIRLVPEIKLVGDWEARG
ncbi:MAG: UDP-N-acetylmuramate dehydrogenase [Candidatus Binatia bacterium]